MSPLQLWPSPTPPLIHFPHSSQNDFLFQMQSRTCPLPASILQYLPKTLMIKSKLQKGLQGCPYLLGHCLSLKTHFVPPSCLVPSGHCGLLLSSNGPSVGLLCLFFSMSGIFSQWLASCHLIHSVSSSNVTFTKGLSQRNPTVADYLFILLHILHRIYYSLESYHLLSPSKCKLP